MLRGEALSDNDVKNAGIGSAAPEGHVWVDMYDVKRETAGLPEATRRKYERMWHRGMLFRHFETGYLAVVDPRRGKNGDVEAESDDDGADMGYDDEYGEGEASGDGMEEGRHDSNDDDDDDDDDDDVNGNGEVDGDNGDENESHEYGQVHAGDMPADGDDQSDAYTASS